MCADKTTESSAAPRKRPATKRSRSSSASSAASDRGDMKIKKTRAGRSVRPKKKAKVVSSGAEKAADKDVETAANGGAVAASENGSEAESSAAATTTEPPKRRRRSRNPHGHTSNPDVEFIEPRERAMRKGPVRTLCHMYMRQVDPTIRVQRKAQAIMSLAIEEEGANQMKRAAVLATHSHRRTVKRQDMDLQHKMVYEAANGLAFFPVDRPKRPESDKAKDKTKEKVAGTATPKPQKPPGKRTPGKKAKESVTVTEPAATAAAAAAPSSSTTTAADKPEPVKKAPAPSKRAPGAKANGVGASAGAGKMRKPAAKPAAATAAASTSTTSSSSVATTSTPSEAFNLTATGTQVPATDE